MDAMNTGYVIPAVSCTRNDRFATRRRKARRKSHNYTRQSVKNAMCYIYRKKNFNYSSKEAYDEICVVGTPPGAAFSDVKFESIYHLQELIMKYASSFERQISLCHCNRRIYFWDYLRLLTLRQSRQNNASRSFDLTCAYFFVIKQRLTCIWMPGFLRAVSLKSDMKQCP